MRLNELVPGLARHTDATVTFFSTAGLERRTFRELGRDVEATTERLRRRGLEPGMHVGFLADNGYDWLVHDLALLELDCCVTALTHAIVGDRLQTVMDEFGLEVVLSVGAAAEAHVAAAPAEWAIRASDDLPIKARPRAVAARPAPNHDSPFRIFSSGSTGAHRCIAASRVGLEGAIENIGKDFAVNSRDTLLLFLPVANLQQKAIAYASLEHGVSLAITDPLRLFPMLKQGRPTILLAPPLFYDTLARRLRAGFVGRIVGLLAPLDRIPLLRLLASPVLRGIGRRVAGELGGRIRLLFTGMAPIGRATLDTLRALGLPIYEGYGTTETGNIACNAPGASRAGSVGRLANGIRVKIGPDGEIFAIREPPLTLGYLDDPEGAKSTYLSDGWVATGDIGSVDSDGFLHLRGRKKNIIILSDGQKLHPEVLEKEIATSPVIQQCAVLSGDSSGLVLAVHLPDDHPASRAAARAHIERCIENLGQGSVLEEVVFLPEAFSPTNGLLTANLKLNRPALKERVRIQRNSTLAQPEGPSRAFMSERMG